ncbi:hypothetical protein [Halorubrum ezzemoulense]|uniref:hypothetical protein n=1 Tax=Halorubrum ezzemoulense TaxID=337243 RepID=UPI00113FC411|nr:hypothetical protein [Halorubrum ezzemoulense]
MLNEYRGKDGRSISTIDTVDLLGILSVVFGAAVATTGLASIFGVVFADYALTYSGTSVGAGILMIVAGFGSIIFTNGLSREEFLNANTLEGVMTILAGAMTFALFLEPQIVVDMIINNNWGQFTVTGLYATVAGLLATQ